MSAGSLITGKLSPIAKIDIAAAKTAFSDQTSCEITVDPNLLEIVSSSANASWVGRDVESLTMSGTLRVAIPAATDAAAEEVRGHALAGTSDEMTFTIPHSTPTILTVTVFFRFRSTGAVGDYYFEEYELFSDGSVVET